jgi:hypothetical protein
MRGWNYRYLGPAELRALVRPGGEGRAIRSLADFKDWVSARSQEELGEPFTFVIDMDGVLRLAPRRSEHVVCAGGGQVLSAGEMSFDRPAGRWAAIEVSNQSTGYRPTAAHGRRSPTRWPGPSWSTLAASRTRWCSGAVSTARSTTSCGKTIRVRVLRR